MPNVPPPDDRPLVTIRREIRFAVVLYGGVSLAIYINGVVRELLAMVRATALGVDGRARFAYRQLSGTEKVYRRLAQARNADQTPPLDEDGLPRASGPIQTRFVVDIISGTSAGGINGIFLGKALARGQSLDELATLWRDLADVSTLLYDQKRQQPIVPYDDPPPSVLNGNRMLRLLHKALSDMDGSSGPALVDMVDCYATTTDIRGLPTFLRLSDESVAESWHKKVFHFHFDDQQRSDGADFAPRFNAMLALAARCTSAFPAAFEPVMIADLDRVLGLTGASDPAYWRPFFSEYCVPQLAQTEGRGPRPDGVYDARHHAFGDGGYLDNKPFSHAINALAQRRGTFPTERKLIYIDPSPEHPEDAPDSSARPTVVTNVMAALFLARNQTIREELERVTTRNALIDRIGHIVSGTEGALAVAAGSPCYRPPPATPTIPWHLLGLADMMRAHGRTYVGYHRLKVAAVTDDVTTVLASLAGFAPDSAAIDGLRVLVRAWRDIVYTPDVDATWPRRSADLPIPDTPPERPIRTQNSFLFDYDLGYRLRRLSFALSRVDGLSCLTDRAREFLEVLRIGDGATGWDLVFERSRANDTSPFVRPVDTWTEPEHAAFRAALAHAAHALGVAYNRLLRAREALDANVSDPVIDDYIDGLPVDKADDAHLLWRARVGAPNAAEANALTKAVSAAFISALDLGKLLEPYNERDQDRAASDMIRHENNRWTRLCAVARVLSERLRKVFVAASTDVSTELGTPPTDPLAIPLWPSIRAIVEYFYNAYDCYDEMVFPIQYATSVGDELVPVAVTRVSPEDAKAVVDERTQRPPDRPKLAGTALHDFGAFFDRGWRTNDISWGRLDGAERLMTAVLSGTPSLTVGAPADWIAAAHAAIFTDLENESTQTIQDAFADVVGALSGDDCQTPVTAATAAARASDDAWSRAISGRIRVSDVAVAWRALSRGIDGLRTSFRNGTNTSRQMNPTVAMNVFARATRIIGRMLDGLAAAPTTPSSAAPVMSRTARVLAFLGSGLWGLVELATPGSWSRRLGTHVFWLVFVLVAILVAASFLPEFQTLFAPSVAVLGVLLAIGVLVQITRGIMVGKPLALRVVAVVVSVAVVAGLGIGALETVRHGCDDLRAINPMAARASLVICPQTTKPSSPR
jgi:patatin-related protein